MKKLLSTMFAITMVFACAVASYAATDYTFTIRTSSTASQSVTVTNHEDLAREVLTLVNSERRKEGLTGYAWDGTLVNAAIRRGAEASIATDTQNSKHLRPDNSEWYTVSDLVRGENLAGGFKTAEDVVTAWMNSEGHKKNILKDNFTSMAVACIEAEDGNYHWVQLFGVATVSSSSSTSSSNSTSTGTSASSSAASATASSNVSSDGSINATTIQTEANAALSAAEAGTVATVRAINAKTISSATLQSLAEASATAGKTLVLHADTTNTGGGILGRLYLRPDLLRNGGSAISLGVTAQGTAVETVKADFEKWFSVKSAVVRLDQQGSFGTTLEIAAKADLSGLDTKNLLFYSYDRASNKYAQIEEPAYSVDSAGYLHFFTAAAGDIVITDKPLP